MSLSNITEADALDMFLRGLDPAYRAGTTQYVALFTADPTETGSIAAEATYTGYARVAITKASAWTGDEPYIGFIGVQFRVQAHPYLGVLFTDRRSQNVP